MCFRLEICISEKKEKKENEDVEPFFFFKKNEKGEMENVYPYGENFSPKGTEE